MKIITKLLFLVLAFRLEATPFYLSSLYSDGTPNTNLVLMSAWPSANVVTTYGTNVVYGGAVKVLKPNANGYVTNWALPNTYRFQITNVGVAFLAVLPDTATNVPLSLFITDTPRYTGNLLSNYELVTNWLTFAPATNNLATNVLVYVSGVSFQAATNGYITNVTLTLSTNTIYYQR